MAKRKIVRAGSQPESRKTSSVPDDEAIISDIEEMTLTEGQYGTKRPVGYFRGDYPKPEMVSIHKLGGGHYKYQRDKKRHFTEKYAKPRTEEHFKPLVKEVQTLTPTEQEEIKKAIEGEEKTRSGSWTYDNVKRPPRQGSRIFKTIQEVKGRGSEGMSIEEFQGGPTGNEHLQERIQKVKARGFGCPWRNLRPYTKGTRGSQLELRDNRVYYVGK